MKKLLSGIIGLTVMLSALPIYGAEPEVFVNNGTIEINDKINDAVLNDEITVNVVKSDFDWDAEAVWSDENYQVNSDNIKYYDIIKADANGKYSIKFKLDEMGKYTVYLGSGYYKQPVVKEFYYTNEGERETAIDTLNKAVSADAVAELIKNNRYAFMLYSDKYTEADLDEVGRLVYEYLSEVKTDLSAEEATDAIYKGMMVNFLNTLDIKDMSDYSDCFGMNESCISEYWSESYGKTVAEKLEDESVKTISEYDEAMFYITAGCIIENNDGTDGIKAVLNEYAERSGSSVKITNNMCSEIAGEVLYTEDALKDWLSDYKKDNNTGSGGGGGGSSSGGGYKTEHYDAAADSPFNAGYQQQEKEDLSELEGLFTDIDDVEWAKEAIEALYSRGIIAGRTERTFEPNDTVLREEFVKLLTAVFNLNLISEDMSFADVDENAWYYKYVNSAYAAGVAKGFSDEIFGIGENITRQDLCVMIDNALNICEINPSEGFEEKSFTDEGEIADYAKDSVARMQKLGVVNGYTDGSFNPNGTATRAEAAKIIYMISTYIV